MSLQGKVAIVTGSSSGVGEHTALQLAQRGCDVVVNYRGSRAAAEAVAGRVEATGVRSLCVQADVAEDGEARALVAATGEAFGRLDFLVNNAGATAFIPHDDLEAIEMADVQRIMAVNVMGPLQVTRAARALLSADGGGHVVNVGSIAGLRGMGSSIPYCASKAALHNLTLSLARVLAPAVQVNAVAPGFIAGRWLQEGHGDDYAKLKARQERRAALGKVCEPADVADAILALLTGSALVTGQVLPVEGGALLAV